MCFGVYEVFREFRYLIKIHKNICMLEEHR